MEPDSINEGWVFERPEVIPAKKQAKAAPLGSHGRLYVQLLEDPRLKAMDKLCFGVMGSFGSESRASVPSIARRMGVAENTARRAQKKLEAAGWLKFLGVGQGGLKHWDLLRPAKSEGPGSQQERPPPVSGEAPGVQLVKVKQEGNLEHKQEGEAPSAVGAGEALERFEKYYLATKGKTYKQGGRDRGAAGQLFKEHRISLEEFNHAIESYFQDDERYTTGHLAHIFFERFNAYQCGPIDRGGTQQRQSKADHGSKRGQGSEKRVPGLDRHGKSVGPPLD